MSPKVEDYYNAVAQGYSAIYNPVRPSYGDGIQDYIRLQIVLRQLSQQRARSVFEVGVGDGTPLDHMYRMGLQVAGCDIAPQMVAVSRERLVASGLVDPPIWHADIEDAVQLAGALLNEPADAVVALGVMPHVDKDVVALKNMRAFVRTGGKILVEFRNQLFSLFTFNRYTSAFILEELLAPVGAEVKARVAEELQRMLRMDLPPQRTTAPDGSSPGYDVIRAKFHNPFEIQNLLAQAGFINPRLHWYHFHASMPMLQGELGDDFDRESLALEHSLVHDWRGYFLCSAVLVEADAA